MDEKKLIKKAVKGDLQAFDTLIREYEVRVYNIALKMVKNEDDAKDVAQEALIKVYRKLKDFNFNSTFSTWIYRITMNTSLDFLRKKKRELDRVMSNKDEGDQVELISKVHVTQDTPEQEIVKQEQVQALRQGLDALNTEHKTVILLRDIEGLSYKEIADILETTEGTVKSRLNRGRRKLKSILSTMELFKEKTV